MLGYYEAVHTSTPLSPAHTSRCVLPLSLVVFTTSNAGYYNDTLFHRSIKNFMIQAGGVNVFCECIDRLVWPFNRRTRQPCHCSNALHDPGKVFLENQSMA